MKTAPPPGLLTALAPLPLGPLEYHASLGSTNDLAAEQLANGAADRTLIVADEQTRGRGRLGRSWLTPPGAALAFSLILRPLPGEPGWAFTALGALAVHDALAARGLPAAVKWPNDVLIGGKKVCGVLAEADWQGSSLQGIVLGIGVNVRADAVPAAGLPFPATCVEAALGPPVDRWDLLAHILQQLLAWRSRIASPDFLSAWEARLAYRGDLVRVGSQEGILDGLDPGGGLRLRTPEGLVSVSGGDLSLRPSGAPHLC